MLSFNDATTLPTAEEVVQRHLPEAFEMLKAGL